MSAGRVVERGSTHTGRQELGATVPAVKVVSLQAS